MVHSPERTASSTMGRVNRCRGPCVLLWGFRVRFEWRGGECFLLLHGGGECETPVNFAAVVCCCCSCTIAFSQAIAVVTLCCYCTVHCNHRVMADIHVVYVHLVYTCPGLHAPPHLSLLLRCSTHSTHTHRFSLLSHTGTPRTPISHRYSLHSLCTSHGGGHIIMNLFFQSHLFFSFQHSRYQKDKTFASCHTTQVAPNMGAVTRMCLNLFDYLSMHRMYYLVQCTNLHDFHRV